MSIPQRVADQVAKETQEVRNKFSLTMDAYQLSIVKKALDLFGHRVEEKSNKLTLEVMAMNNDIVAGKNVPAHEERQLNEQYNLAKFEYIEIDNMIDAIESQEKVLEELEELLEIEDQIREEEKALNERVQEIRRKREQLESQRSK